MGNSISSVLVLSVKLLGQTPQFSPVIFSTYRQNIAWLTGLLYTKNKHLKDIKMQQNIQIKM